MITEDKVKDLVNWLIEYKASNIAGFDEKEMFMRVHGINLAINAINGNLLGQFGRSADEKHLPQTELLTA